MRTRLALLIAVCGLVAALPSAALAKTRRLPTGSTKYLRIVHVNGDMSVVLTPLGRSALKGRLRGEVLSATCTTLGRGAHGLQTSTQSSGTAAGQPANMPVLDPHADFCDISLAHQAANGTVGPATGPPFASVALDQRGARFLDEDRVTQELYAVLNVATELSIKDPHQNFPAAGRVTALLRGHAVVLRSAAGSPRAGLIGVFSNGRNRLEIVGRSALGRRLFIAYTGDVLSTNVSEHLFRLASGQAATLG